MAYSSRADYLVPADENGMGDIFVTNRINKQTERVSLDVNGDEVVGFASYYPAISGDGQYVVFQSLSSFGIADDTNGSSDIFRYDRQENLITRVSVSTSGQQASEHWVTNPDISDDGRYVVFETSDTNLVEDDDNICQGVAMNGQIYSFPCSDIFMRDTLSNITTRISVDGTGQQVTGSSTSASINANGRYVAFQSTADSLVNNDNNNSVDIFVKNTASGAVERVSVASNGAEANDGNWNPKISADGRFVTFESRATNLVADDDNGVIDIFVHDRLTKETRRVSVCPCGTEANDDSLRSTINGDGQVIAYTSAASNLLIGLSDTNNMRDIFLYEWDPLPGDADAIPDNGEYGPTSAMIEYDGNEDGIPDASQSHVVSVSNFDSNYYVTFAAHDGKVFEEFVAIDNPSVDDSPAEMGFPRGFFEFTLTGLDSEEAFTIILHLPAGITLTNFWMYGATIDEGSAHWYDFSYDGTTGAQISGNTITLHFENGNRGDDDLTTNDDSITVRGGPAVSMVQDADINVTPISIGFAPVTIGSSAGPEIVTITNIGCSNLELTSFTITGEDELSFSVSLDAGDNPCGTTPKVLASLESCTIGVLFSPSQDGVHAAILEIASTDPDEGVFQVSLSGTAVIVATQKIAVSPTSYDFGYVAQNSTSAPLIVTLFNLSSNELNVSAISGSTTFNEQYELATNVGLESCGTIPFSIAGDADCTMQVVFTPTVAASTIATLTITSNDSVNPELPLTFRGTGTESVYVPPLLLSPATIDFGEVAFGTSSMPVVLTVTNLSDAPILNTGLMVIPPPISGYPTFWFNCPDNNPCPFWDSIAPGESCNYSITYRPYVNAIDEGTISIIGDNGEKSNTVHLYGRGFPLNVSVAQKLSVTPGTIDFTELPVGFNEPDGGLHVRLSNSGGADLRIQHIGISDVQNFSIEYEKEPDGCLAPPFTLPAGYDCNIFVRFHPMTSGQLNAMMAINSDDPDSDITAVSISGSAFELVAQPTIRLSAQSYDFGHGDINLSTVPEMKSTKIYLSNIGTPPLTVISITLSKNTDFTLTPCQVTPFTLNSVEYCGLSVLFNPDSVGPLSDTITIHSNDPNSPTKVITLSGIGANDLDGLPDDEENGLNGDDPGYDGDNSGIADNQEAHVASLHTSDDQNYVTLFTNSNQIHLSEVTAADKPSPADAPLDALFPLGFFEFTACCVDQAGGNMTVTIKIPAGVTLPNTYYKFGPTPDNPVPHWYEFLYNGTTGAQISDTEIVLNFVDGERGDDDLLPNQSITDIGAPMFKTSDKSEPVDGGGGSCFIAFHHFDFSYRILRD